MFKDKFDVTSKSASTVVAIDDIYSYSMELVMGYHRIFAKYKETVAAKFPVGEDINVTWHVIKYKVERITKRIN